MAAASTNATELRWLIRIILKNMGLSISTNAILQSIHPDAPSFWNVCADLKKLCRVLADPSQRFEEGTFEVSLFNPIVPMLAERQSIQNAFGTASILIAEPKIDGERAQLHTDGITWRYWSRRGVEYTHLYGSNSTEGSLTCHIAEALGGESVILDGEMIGFDEATGAHVPFGTLKSIAAATLDGYHGKEAELNSSQQHPSFIVFDILFYQGKSLLQMPLTERRVILERLIPQPIGNHLKVIQQFPVEADKVAPLLDQILADRGEGLVLKDPHSKYHPGVRSRAWTKVKPDYVDALCDDIDVLVLGGSHGRGLGSLPNSLANFCCGVYDVAKSTADKPHYSFLCRVGSGFSREDLDRLALSMTSSLVPYRRPSEVFDVPLLLPDRPDFVLQRIEDGMVFQIKAHALQRSSETSSGWTLRFPRFIRQRSDKDYKSVTTTADLEKIFRTSNGTMARSSVLDHLLATTSSSGISTKRPASLLRGRMAKARIDERFQSSHSEEPQIPASRVLSGREYWVLYGDEKSDKAALEQMIRNLGGEIVQGPPRTAVITGKRDGLRVGNLRKQGTIDLVLPEWVRACAAAGALLPFHPDHVIFLTEATQKSQADEQLNNSGDVEEFSSDQDESD